MQRRRPHPLLGALALLSACVAIALTGPLPASRGHSHNWTLEPARGIGPQGPCPAPSGDLNPGGALTFLYRLQIPFDAERFGMLRANNPGAYPVRSNDVFLVRARTHLYGLAPTIFKGLTDAARLSGEQFRCNRITAWTGSRATRGLAREYAYNSAGDPRVWGVSPDWERPFFRLAYPDGSPRWRHHFGTNVRRLRELARGIHRRGRSAGAVVTGAHAGIKPWDWGLLAKKARLDWQIVQIQPSCVNAVRLFKNRARNLVGEYRRAGIPLTRLGVEVSFSENPGATRWKGDVSAGRAASCVRAAYRVGVRGFLLWAQPTSLDEFFVALPDSLR
jgi:hypothetical protein